ncbi:MAG TPA: hypothetical protein VNE40_00425 [Candidatus Dormibacteraeota bacterium]|nr:hypothetical protein [Candidatus Dormibacteraeota bacterium]
MAKIVTSDYAQMLLNGVDNFTATYFSEVIGLAVALSFWSVIKGIVKIITIDQ